MAKKLILTVGLPRSGKSTWARYTNHPIVNPDAIRLAMHGLRFQAVAEQWVWPMVFTMASALFLAGHETVVVDATNVSARRRNERINKFPGYEIELKVFDTSPEECKKRAILTGQEDLLPVIDRMVKDWDLPKPWATEDR